MKIKLKKQILTGIAAIALVAPLILGGTANDVHADNTAAPQATMPASDVNNSTSQTTPPASGVNTSASQTTPSNGQPSANNQPKKTITMQQLKQMMAQQAAKQKQQLAKEMKGAMDIFVAQGNEVYTAKAKGTKLFPTTMKKYMPLNKFKKVMKSKSQRLRHDALRYRATRNKKYLNDYKNNFKYMRFGRIPTQKQMAKMQKQQAQQQAKQAKQKQNRSSVKNKKSTRKGKLTNKSRRNNKRHVHKNTRSRKTRTVKRSRMNTRIKRNRKKARKNVNRKGRRNRKTSFTVTNTYLKSEYKRGSVRAAKKTGFAISPLSSQYPMMFDRYKPNDRRAIIPRNYHIIPNSTMWLTGRYTNNNNKIEHMKNVYYYNGSYRGWANIGYRK